MASWLSSMLQLTSVQSADRVLMAFVCVPTPCIKHKLVQLGIIKAVTGVLFMCVGLAIFISKLSLSAKKLSKLAKLTKAECRCSCLDALVAYLDLRRINAWV